MKYYLNHLKHEEQESGVCNLKMLTLPFSFFLTVGDKNQ